MDNPFRRDRAYSGGDVAIILAGLIASGNRDKAEEFLLDAVREDTTAVDGVREVGELSEDDLRNIVREICGWLFERG